MPIAQEELTMDRVALIDLGSNTARLVIYDVLEGGYFIVAEEHREAVSGRAGQGGEGRALPRHERPAELLRH